MFLKKRKFVVVMLVGLIALAVYLNVIYTDDGGMFDITQTVSDKNLGEATLVDNQTNVLQTIGEDQEDSGEDATPTATDTVTQSSDDYFAQSKLSKSKARDESVALLQDVVNNENADEADRQQATAQILSISDAIEKEAVIESLLKAKGFDECIAYISSDSVNIIVRHDALAANQVAQIKDIVLSEVDVQPEQIKIVEIK